MERVFASMSGNNLHKFYIRIVDAVDGTSELTFTSTLWVVLIFAFASAPCRGGCIDYRVSNNIWRGMKSIYGTDNVHTYPLLSKKTFSNVLQFIFYLFTTHKKFKLNCMLPYASKSRQLIKISSSFPANISY